MHTTKTGISIPDEDDKYYGVHDAVKQLWKIVTRMGEVIDDLADRIEELEGCHDN